jgi:hypothetical protein
MMHYQKNMFSKIAFELGNTVKTSILDNKASKFPLSFKSFSSRAFYEAIPEAVVPEVEDKIFLAQKIENVSALPHELPEDSILVTLPVNRMGSFDLLRVDFKALNEKFNRLELSNVELKSSNVELKSSNVELKSSIAELKSSIAELKSSNVELKSSIAELKLRNINLINQINFYLEFSSKQLAQYLAMVIVEYTSRRLPSSWEELLKLPIWTKKRPNFTN